MGFGIFLFAYTFILDVGVSINAEYGIGFDVFPDLIGYIVLLIALRKIAAYDKDFGRTGTVSLLLLPVGLLTLGFQIGAWAGLDPKICADALNVLGTAKCVLLFLFHLCWLPAHAKLCSSIGLDGLAKASRVSCVLSCVFWALFGLQPLLSFVKINVLVNILLFLTAFLFYIVLFLNLIILWRSYQMIGYEGEEIPTDVRHPLIVWLEEHRKNDK